MYVHIAFHHQYKTVYICPFLVLQYILYKAQSNICLTVWAGKDASYKNLFEQNLTRMFGIPLGMFIGFNYFISPKSKNNFQVGQNLYKSHIYGPIETKFDSKFRYNTGEVRRVNYLLSHGGGGPEGQNPF
jgi:hypothetical protein